MTPTNTHPSVHRHALAAATVFLATACGLLAAPLKVDISNSGRPLAEGLDPAFTDWATTQNWFTGGNTTSRTFDGVTVTFTRVGPVGTALKTGYWKAGVQSTAYNVKLTGDGLKVDTPDAAAEAAGSQIEMRISGMTAGAHTLLLYLNNWDGTTSNAPLDILVNGTQVVNDLPVSTQVTDNNNATTSYLDLTAVAGQDVVILIKAETSGSQTSKNVHINGFEIDNPNVERQANNPVPANADEHVDADSGSLTLGWGTAVLGAASHHVYFGTSESAVTNATTASPEYKGNQTSNTWPATGINTHLTYYWRVDEVAANGAVTKGNVWMFRPRRLAFPGAEGYGRFARGGRGGVVRHVTNLNDSGAGSLRDAIEGNYGPRTIIFDVSGLITLNDDITIGGTLPYITIAGQTAPGKGICIKRQQLTISGGDDIIIRYVRGLVGKESGETQNATGMAGADHCIMDHCTFGWGIDEGLSTRGGKNLTFQRCSLSEALNVAGHQNYGDGTAHGYAASVGGDIASLHHNLLAHNEGRNWSMAGGLDGAGFYAGRLDIFNNVVYNWAGRTTDGGAMEVNFVNNYYKRGPVNGITTLLNPDYGGFPGMQRYYMAGNILLNGSTTQTNQESLLSIGTESGGTLPQNSTPPYSAMVSAPFFPSHATIYTATNAYKQVLSDVGCNLPQIDNHDTRVINETLNGTFSVTGSVSGKKGLPDTTVELGGWENYGNETRPAGFDTDNDGMPDWWETIKGFNTNSAANDFTESNSDTDGDGYTALEDYLNWKASPNVECAAGSSIDIDLQALSVGYSKTTPAYTFTGPAGGTVSLVSGRYARFTPTSTANALGGFTYKVTDSAGDSMTRTVNVRITGTGTGAPPLPPTGLNATPATGQVALSWTASAGATGYIVKRSTASGGNYMVVGSPAGTSFTDTGLTGGTAYFYVVTAVNGDGESGSSSQASATPPSVIPAIPSGLSATAGNAQASLTWTAVPGATSYVVRRASIGLFTTVGSPTGNSFTNTGLSNGTTYYYVVSAVNGSGESTTSSQVSVKPVAGTPSAPTGLNATAGNAQVSLTWTAVSGATSYNIKRSTTSGSGYTTVGNATTNSYVNTGLTNGTTYYYVVSAANSSGESGNSAQATATPQLTAPSAPAGLNATAGDTQISLTWTASSGATSYNVKRSTTSGSGYTTIASPTTNSFTNTGLTNGTPYFYVVTAVNGAGESANSTQATATPAVAGSSVTIQAETGVLGTSTAVEQGSASNAGWNGTGYVNFPMTGGSLQFNNISGGTGGSATLAIRFTIGNTSSRTGNLVVNGVTQSITFPGTTTWSNWTMMNVSVPLNSGATNTLRFESTGADLANLDELTITPAAAVPPTVTIAATDNSAGEYGADQAISFTVTRTGATTAALVVPLVASGSASGGSDYSGFASSVIIPIGQAGVALPLTVLPDALSEGPENVTIALGASASFTAGSPASASATIADNPSQGYFFSSISDPAKRGPLDDADGDSTANVIEYFIGSLPGDAASNGLLTIPSTGPSTFKVRYPRAKNRPDVSGSLRWSVDLGNWFASAGSNGTHTVTFAEAVVSEPAADPETVEATATITGAGNAPTIFVRLGVW